MRGTRPDRAALRQILLVDDDADERRSLGNILEQEGYDVVMKANGAEALEYLHCAPRPSAILIDLVMPVMDGWTFLKERNLDEELHSIPVIVVSGHNVEKEVISEDAGYLAKPVSTERLTEALRQVIH
jgi:CheY-like chemotaxis protein